MFPASFFLVALLPCAAFGQAVLMEWPPEEMLNPQTTYKSCGLSAPGYVCDPNRILGKHVDLINWKLADAAHNSTRCPCSNYYCEDKKQHGPKGYHVGVAVIKKMKIQENAAGRRNSLEDQANLFAHRLESNAGWAMGNCEEDIIIFYSADDKMLAIFAGSTALKKLTPYNQELLLFKASDRLEKGLIVEAISVLLHDLKIILNCESTTHDCNLHEVRSSAGLLSTSLAVLSVAALSSLINIF